jgi:protein CpxP
MKSTTGIGRFLIVLLAMVMIAGMVQMAFAQGQGMRMTPAQRADTLGKQLSLTPEVVKKVAGIYEKYQKLIADKRAELQGDMDAMRAAMTEIRADQNKEITALLTKEQTAKYEVLMKQQQQRMMNRPPRNN